MNEIEGVAGSVSAVQEKSRPNGSAARWSGITGAIPARLRRRSRYEAAANEIRQLRLAA